MSETQFSDSARTPNPALRTPNSSPTSYRLRATGSQSPPEPRTPTSETPNSETPNSNPRPPNSDPRTRPHMLPATSYVPSSPTRSMTSSTTSPSRRRRSAEQTNPCGFLRRPGRRRTCRTLHLQRAASPHEPRATSQAVLSPTRLPIRCSGFRSGPRPHRGRERRPPRKALTMVPPVTMTVPSLVTAGDRTAKGGSVVLGSFAIALQKTAAAPSDWRQEAPPSPLRQNPKGRAPCRRPRGRRDLMRWRAPRRLGSRP